MPQPNDKSWLLFAALSVIMVTSLAAVIYVVASNIPRPAVIVTPSGQFPIERRQEMIEYIQRQQARWTLQMGRVQAQEHIKAFLERQAIVKSVTVEPGRAALDIVFSDGHRASLPLSQPASSQR